MLIYLLFFIFIILCIILYMYKENSNIIVVKSEKIENNSIIDKIKEPINNVFKKEINEKINEKINMLKEQFVPKTDKEVKKVEVKKDEFNDIYVDIQHNTIIKMDINELITKNITNYYMFSDFEWNTDTYMLLIKNKLTNNFYIPKGIIKFDNNIHVFELDKFDNFTEIIGNVYKIITPENH